MLTIGVYSVYTTLAQAIKFFDITFIRWWKTPNPTDAKALAKFCLLQGQSWDSITAKWNTTRAVSRNQAALDEYTWWINSIHGIFAVGATSLSIVNQGTYVRPIQLYQEGSDAKAESMFTDYTTSMSVSTHGHALVSDEVPDSTLLLEDAVDPNHPLVKILITWYRIAC